MPTDGSPDVDPLTASGFDLRPATAADLPALADLQLRSRAAAYPAMPRGVHPPHEVHSWFASWDLGRREVWLAERGHGGAPLGYTMVLADWLDDLYVDPAAARAGVGSALLDLVKSRRPGGFCLWVFESNRPARAFYARHGLVELERTDGSANEERSPDLRLAWPGEDPAAYLSGLLAEVGADLGAVRARRTALLRALGSVRT